MYEKSLLLTQFGLYTFSVCPRPNCPKLFFPKQKTRPFSKKKKNTNYFHLKFNTIERVFAG